MPRLSSNSAVCRSSSKSWRGSFPHKHASVFSFQFDASIEDRNLHNLQLLWRAENFSEASANSGRGHDPKIELRKKGWRFHRMAVLFNFMMYLPCEVSCMSTMSNVNCALTKGMSFSLSEKDCDSSLKRSKCIFIAECKLFTPSIFKTSSRNWKRSYQACSTRTVARDKVLLSQMRKRLSLANPRSDVEVRGASRK